MPHARAAACLCLLLLACLPALAATPPTAEQVEARFIAPCCWTESLAVHRSPTATELRAEIQRKLAAGHTESQIVDDLVARHGERILAVPRGSRATWLMLVPLLAAAAGAALTVRYVARLAA